jgi:hypothetical protein
VLQFCKRFENSFSDIQFEPLGEVEPCELVVGGVRFYWRLARVDFGRGADEVKYFLKLEGVEFALHDLLLPQPSLEL